MNIVQIGNEKLLIDGKEVAPLPKKFNYSIVFSSNNNVYWNGYKYNKETNSWKKSFFGWLMCFL